MGMQIEAHDQEVLSANPKATAILRRNAEPMTKPLLKRISNRALHLLARFLPGCTSVRPFLHRLRGAKIGKDVFIGDDVYLENEHPEAVEIQSGVHISVRAIILAHTRGCGKIVIEKDAFIGISAVLATSGGKTLRIGEGSVVGAGVVVTRDVPAHAFVANEMPKPTATVGLPLTKAETVEDFVRGLSPFRPSKAARSETIAREPAPLLPEKD
jgi:carbonic anhydrase/acetyltransferase-like protein (isoleucine patch superfamily)